VAQILQKFLVEHLEHFISMMDAKAIYSLKLFLFQQQFTLTNKEKNSVKELGLSVSRVCVPFWHEALLGRKAPHH